MNKLLGVMFAAALLVGVGCSDKDKDMKHKDASMSSSQMMSADACAHCPGIQTATADGKCPVCGAQVVKK